MFLCMLACLCVCMYLRNLFIHIHVYNVISRTQTFSLLNRVRTSSNCHHTLRIHIYLYVCIYVYVCMHACMYACMYVWVYTACMIAWMHVCMHTYTHVHPPFPCSKESEHLQSVVAARESHPVMWWIHNLFHPAPLLILRPVHVCVRMSVVCLSPPPLFFLFCALSHPKM